MARDDGGILVTGGGSFLGDHIAAALLAEGAAVSLLIRAGSEDRLGPLAQRTRWSHANVWHPASLLGKARQHSAVIHTIGSLRADPAQGLSYQRLNVVPARNVANMCVSDGVQRLILISSVRAPWISRAYLKSKREAEDYLVKTGLEITIIRAPLLYQRGEARPGFYRLMSALGRLPPMAWTRLGRIAPLPIDILARAAARIALRPQQSAAILYARDLRRLNSREEIRGLPARPA